MDPKISSGFNLIFFLPRLFGAFPFTSGEGKTRLSVPLVLCGLFLRALFSLEYYRNSNNLRENLFPYEQNQFYFVTLIISFTMLYIFASVSYAFTLLNSRLLQRVLTSFARLEKDLSELGVKGFDGYKRSFDCFVLFVGLLPGSLRAVSVKQMTMENFLNTIHIFYLTVNLFMGVYPFIRAVDFLRRRFKKLRNILLQRDCPEKGSKMIASVRLHSILCSASKSLNRCYSIQLLLFYFVNFVIIVTSCYFLVDGIIRNERGLMIFIKCLVIVFCCLICYLITYVCKEASNEVSCN